MNKQIRRRLNIERLIELTIIASAGASNRLAGNKLIDKEVATIYAILKQDKAKRDKLIT